MSRQINVIEAMTDPKLFGATFKPGLLRDPWNVWKTIARALYGMPLSAPEMETFQELTGRTEVLPAGYRESLMAIGRRGGKTRFGGFLVGYEAALRPHPELQPGEIGVAMLTAQDRMQARVAFGYVEAMFDASPILRRMIVSRTKESLSLSNQTRIEVHTSDFRSVRGYTLIAFVGDEIAYWPSTPDSASPDSETLNAVRPGLLTTNGLLLGISSPHAKRGSLWQSQRDDWAQNKSTTLYVRASTTRMNPSPGIRPAIALAKLRDPVSASAEYDAMFRSDLQSFIQREVIDAAVTPGRFELPPCAGVSYSAFTDPAGGSGSDSYTLGIAHLDESGRGVLDLLREANPPFSPEAVTRGFAEVLKLYGIFEVTGDKYAGEFPRELFRKNGVEYRTSALSRSEIYLEFLPHLMSNQVELLDHKTANFQLASLERSTSRTKDNIDHQAGQHDDLSNVLAGVLGLVLGAIQSTGFLDWVRECATATLDALVTPARNLIQFPSDFKKQFAATWREGQRQIAESHTEQNFSESACPVCKSAVHVQRINDFLRCQRDGTQFGYLSNPQLVVMPLPANIDPTVCERCGGATRVIQGAPRQCVVCGHSRPLVLNPQLARGQRS